jgi:hypothetical protein
MRNFTITAILALATTAALGEEGLRRDRWDDRDRDRGHQFHGAPGPLIRLDFLPLLLLAVSLANPFAAVDGSNN